MDRRLSFSQTKKLVGTGMIDHQPRFMMLELMSNPAWLNIRDPITNQIYIEIALHIKLELKTIKD